MQLAWLETEEEGKKLNELMVENGKF